VAGDVADVEEKSEVGGYCHAMLSRRGTIIRNDIQYYTNRKSWIMSKVRLFEVRDRGTCIACAAFEVAVADMSSRDQLIAKRAGYGPDRCVMFGKLDGGDWHYDPYSWSGITRTMQAAHQWLIDHWHEVEPGAVVDVQFILFETPAPKETELGTL
jgi:hypothetical protein